MKPTAAKVVQFIFSAGLLLTFTERTDAQWSVNPAVNKAVCLSSNDQLLPVGIADGNGGAIITWSDNRSGSSNSNIFAQRINAAGVVQWTSNGVAICTAVNSQVDPQIISDGSGGAIITWRDPRVSIFNNDIYAQRINANGIVQWTGNGVPVCTFTNHQSAQEIVSDGKGGGIISWIDQRNGNDADIYAQRIDASGERKWDTIGVAVATEISEQYVAGIISDDSGGAILCWSDYRSANVDIYAQRLDSTGTSMWAYNGAAVKVSPGTQDYSSIISDDNGGAIICWLDNFSGTNDVYIQRINSAGSTEWLGSGIPVCTAADNQEVPKLATDGNGGAIVTWSDLRSGTEYDLYAQRIASTGASQWTGNGVVISSAVNQQSSPSITADGGGGVIIAWDDFRSGNSDLYAQRISSSGSVQWTNNGIALATATGAQMSSRIISDDSSGAIVVWEDYRGGSTSDIYSSRVYPDGSLPVELVSFAAVNRGDQVELHWKTATEVNNHGFEVERKKVSRQGGQAGFKVQDSNGNPSDLKPETLNSGWTRISFVEGAGNSSIAHEYSYTDQVLSFGRYAFRLKQIDRDGKFTYSQDVEVTVGAVPHEFSLKQNFPNPFNPSTTIAFTLQVSGLTTLKIYDAIGREVGALVNDHQESGQYSVDFDASKLSSGMYIYKLTSGSFTQTKKMMMVK